MVSVRRMDASPTRRVFRGRGHHAIEPQCPAKEQLARGKLCRLAVVTGNFPAVGVVDAQQTGKQEYGDASIAPPLTGECWRLDRIGLPGRTTPAARER